MRVPPEQQPVLTLSQEQFVSDMIQEKIHGLEQKVLDLNEQKFHVVHKEIVELSKEKFNGLEETILNLSQAKFHESDQDREKLCSLETKVSTLSQELVTVTRELKSERRSEVYPPIPRQKAAPVKHNSIQKKEIIGSQDRMPDPRPGRLF